MTAQSLTIVLAPNLVDAPKAFDAQPMLALELNRRVQQFLERLFEHWNETQGAGGGAGDRL